MTTTQDAADRAANKIAEMLADYPVEVELPKSLIEQCLRAGVVVDRATTACVKMGGHGVREAAAIIRRELGLGEIRAAMRAGRNYCEGAVVSGALDGDGVSVMDRRRSDLAAIDAVLAKLGEEIVLRVGTHEE